MSWNIFLDQQLSHPDNSSTLTTLNSECEICDISRHFYHFQQLIVMYLTQITILQTLQFIIVHWSLNFWSSRNSSSLICSFAWLMSSSVSVVSGCLLWQSTVGFVVRERGRKASVPCGSMMSQERNGTLSILYVVEQQDRQAWALVDNCKL